MVSKIVHEIKNFHPWLSPIYGSNHSQTRILGLLVVLSNVLMVFFTTALVYASSEPITTNPCFAHKTVDACTSEASFLYSLEQRCAWTPTFEHTKIGIVEGNYCKLRSPYQSFRSIAIAAVFAQLLALPLAWMMKILLVECVFKHTRKINVFTKALPSSEGETQDEARGIWSNHIKAMAVKQLRLLKDNLFRYRLSLSSSSNITFFNLMWNLKTHDDIVFKPFGYPTENSLLIDLEFTNENTFAMHPRKLSRVEMSQMDLHLINTLYRDLVPRRKHGMILKEKWDRDHPRLKTVSRETRFWGLVAVLSIALCVSVYIVWFALSRDASAELLWLWTIFAWFVLDVFVKWPLYVLYTDVFVVCDVHIYTDMASQVLTRLFTRPHSIDQTTKPVALVTSQFNSLHFFCASSRASQWNIKKMIASKIATISSQVPRHLILRDLKAEQSKSVVTTNASCASWIDLKDSNDLFSRFSTNLTQYEKWNIWWEHELVKYMHSYTVNFRQLVNECCIGLFCLVFVFVQIKIIELNSKVLAVPYVTLVLYSVYTVYISDKECNRIAPDISENVDHTVAQRMPSTAADFNAFISNILDSDSSSSSDTDGSIPIRGKARGSSKHSGSSNSDSEKSVESSNISYSDEDMIDSSLNYMDYVLGPIKAEKKEKSVDLDDYMRRLRSDESSHLDIDPLEALKIIDSIIGPETVELQIEKGRKLKQKYKETNI